MDHLTNYFLAPDPDIRMIIEIGRELAFSDDLVLLVSRLLGIKTWAYCSQWCYQHPQTGAEELNRAVKQALYAVPYGEETPATFVLMTIQQGRRRVGWDQLDDSLLEGSRWKVSPGASLEHDTLFVAVIAHVRIIEDYLEMLYPGVRLSLSQANPLTAMALHRIFWGMFEAEPLDSLAGQFFLTHLGETIVETARAMESGTLAQVRDPSQTAWVPYSGTKSAIVEILEEALQPTESLPDPNQIFTDFADWLRNPTPEGFLALREAVIASGRYRPRSLERPLALLEEALEQGRYQHVLDTLYEVEGANFLLSPKAHELIAHAYTHLGDYDSARGAGWTAICCRDAILALGDGSVQRPYPVLHLEDEYDLLNAMQLSPISQSLELNDECCLDIMTLTDGRTIAFDVSALQANQ